MLGASLVIWLECDTHYQIIEDVHENGCAVATEKKNLKHCHSGPQRVRSNEAPHCHNAKGEAKAMQ